MRLTGGRWRRFASRAVLASGLAGGCATAPDATIGSWSSPAHGVSLETVPEGWGCARQDGDGVALRRTYEVEGGEPWWEQLRFEVVAAPEGREAARQAVVGQGYAEAEWPLAEGVIRETGLRFEKLDPDGAAGGGTRQRLWLWAMDGCPLALVAELAAPAADEAAPEALLTLLAAVRVPPGLEARAHVFRGNAAQARGDPEGAMREWSAAVAREPALAEALEPFLALARLELGAALAAAGQAHLGAGRLDEARAALDRAVKFAPGLVAARVVRGELRLRRDESPQALEDLDEAVRLDATAPAARYWRAVVLGRLSRTADAIEDLTLALALGGSHAAEAQALLAQLTAAGPR